MSFYVPNPDFAEEALRSSEIRDLVKNAAESAAELYAEGVPVSSGDLRDSVFSDVAQTADGWRGRVGATDWKAGLIELGSSSQPPNGALRRSVESVGLEVGDDQVELG